MKNKGIIILLLFISTLLLYLSSIISTVLERLGKAPDKQQFILNIGDLIVELAKTPIQNIITLWQIKSPPIYPIISIYCDYNYLYFD